MKRIGLHWFFVAAVALHANAQWMLIHPYPQNSSVEEMKFIDVQRGWFVTGAGTIWRTTDGGATWVNQRTYSSWGLATLEFADPLNGWAGGTNGPLLRTTNSGEQWSVLGYRPSLLTQLRFTSLANGWAATGTGAVLRTSNAAANWDSSFQWPLEFDEDVWVPPGPIVGLSVVDSTTAYLIGERSFRRGIQGLGNIIARTTNGGAVWDTLRINFPGSVTDIAFINKSRGWYLTDSATVTGTTDGGGTWRREFGPLPSSAAPLCDLYTVAPMYAWAVGDRGLLVRTTDAGTTWTVSTIDSAVHFRSVVFVDHLVGWCGGSYGQIYRTSDGGGTWTRLSRGAPHFFRAVEFLTPQRGWAASGWVDDVRLYHTTDGGVSWSPQLSASGGYFGDIEMVDTLLGWAVGSIDSPFKLFRTTNGGDTWQAQPVPLGTTVQGVVFADSRHGWIYGDYIGSPGPEYQVVHRTTNGGQTWSAVVLDTNAFTPTVLDFVALDSLVAWCVSQRGVYRTLDGGASWHLIFNDNSHAYKASITFVDASNGWIAGGDGGLVLHTTDGGSSWRRQTSGTNRQLECIRFADTRRGWAVGLGIMIRTTDGGETWLQDTVQTYPYMFDLSLLAYANTLHAWAVGFSGSVFKHQSPLTSVVDGRAERMPKTFALYQNYPNPFNPATIIKFELPLRTDGGGASSKFASLKVYDVLGREVRTLVNEALPAGRYHVTFDANGLTTGVYFYRLRVGDDVGTMKMLFIR